MAGWTSAPGGLVASGWLTAAPSARLLVTGYMNHTASLGGRGMDDLRWHRPVRAGRAVGRTVAGRPTLGGPVLGTTVSKMFDLELACTGLLAPGAAREASFDPVSETVTTISRAHYYPGWSRITVEMTADRETGRGVGVRVRDNCGGVAVSRMAT